MTPDDKQLIPQITLWRAEKPAPFVTRVAILGDFLPAGPLLSTPSPQWRDEVLSVSPYFDDISATFLNLESTLETNGLPPRRLNGIGEIVSARTDVLDYLAAIKCRAVGLANNHIHDFGQDGVSQTRKSILEQGLTPTGVGRMLKDSPDIFVWSGLNDLRIGFWACGKAVHELATRKIPGIEPATRNRAAHALTAMKREGARFFIALVHAGCLRSNRIAPEDASLLRELARPGFDIVAASHSHRIAGHESLARPTQTPSFCFHGLGSIVSGYIASDEEREGLIVVAGFDTAGNFVELNVRPVHLGANGLGEVPEPVMAEAILDRFASLSSEIADGSATQKFYDEISPGLVSLYARDLRAACRESGIRGLARKAVRIRPAHLKRLLHTVLSA